MACAIRFWHNFETVLNDMRSPVLECFCNRFGPFFVLLCFVGGRQLEGKLRKALSEVEVRERQLKAREESWKSDHAQKLSELQLLQRRLREETKHQVWMAV